jgi:phosphoribosyl 1,2-cyclic phosphate phosphodiesterase
VEVDGLTIVIDSGPDFRQQMLRAGVQQLDAILLTHEHKDHVAGMDDIRAFNFINRKAMDIYAEERVHSALMFLQNINTREFPGSTCTRLKTSPSW